VADATYLKIAPAPTLETFECVACKATAAVHRHTARHKKMSDRMPPEGWTFNEQMLATTHEGGTSLSKMLKLVNAASVLALLCMVGCL
jgi:hypothetical protein